MTEMREKVKALAARVNSLFAGEQWEACIRACTELLALMDKDLSARPNEKIHAKAGTYQNRGVAYAAVGMYDAAFNDFGTSLELNPGRAKTYFDRGYAHYCKGDVDLAIADYNNALELDSNLARAYNYRGLAYGKKGEFDRAIADYNRALKIKPEDADAYINRAAVYSANGDYDRAIADCTKAIEITPSFPAYTNRANAYTNKGDYDRAIPDYDQALKFRPNETIVVQARAIAFFHKNAEKAQEEMRKQSEEQLKKQQKQFESDLEKRINKYDINLLRIEEYEARRKEFQNEAKEAREKMQKWLGVLRWIAGGFVALVLLCMGYTFWKGPGIWPIFPLITAAAGLCAFPFIWQIRTLKQEEARLMALSQDAYTKGILANLINVNLGAENRKELLHKFFDHHAQHGSA
ncbi:MAG: tetratricopeptide repeat protein, partial [Alphaproteobacteria bacterium]|nr:tetratricopeptide repeat protein [Alphaproteobacteria bacterium]